MSGAHLVLSLVERLQLQIRIAYSLRCCGRIEQAIAILKKVHSQSVAEGLASTLYFASWRLCTHYLDAGDMPSTLLWFDEFGRIAPIGREPLADMLYHFHATRIAIAKVDFPTAKRHHAVAIASFPEQGHLIRYSHSLACALGVARIGGDVGELQAQIRIASPIYTKARNRLGQAFFATELSLSLSMCGRGDEGREILHSYMTKYRREPGPLPRLLTDANQILANA